MQAFGNNQFEALKKIDATNVQQKMCSRVIKCEVGSTIVMQRC
jgi:hypothetical protein